MGQYETMLLEAKSYTSEESCSCDWEREKRQKSISMCERCNRFLGWRPLFQNNTVSKKPQRNCLLAYIIKRDWMENVFGLFGQLKPRHAYTAD